MKQRIKELIEKAPVERIDRTCDNGRKKRLIVKHVFSQEELDRMKKPVKRVKGRAKLVKQLSKEKLLEAFKTWRD